MLQPFLLAAVSLLAGYLYLQLHHKRFKQYANFPQLPSSLLWGHLAALGEAIQRGKPDRHSDWVFIEINESLGRPPLMFVDLRPVNPPMVFIRDHELAEQVSKATQLMPWSVPKSPTFGGLVHVLGPKSILTREGDEWKRLRKSFNPAFAPQHLMTLLPSILSKTKAYVRHLEHFARNGDEFSLSALTINLTFDIIGTVVMDHDMDAQEFDQSRRGGIILLYNQLLDTYAGTKADLPSWAMPLTMLRRHRVTQKLDGLLKSVVRAKFEEKAEGQGTISSRSVLSLSLQDVDVLTPTVLDETVDQVKTFLLAGHDTTSITLAWSIYEIWRTPRVLQAMRAELDGLFGKDTGPEEVHEKLLSPEGAELVRSMPYISAIIKEILRLYPPAGTARMPPPGTGFTVRTAAGDEYCLDGTVIYNCETAIQRDPAIYGESANDFVPERWLGEAAGKIPASAWRPFERGPRNCIGQELANIEARIILALVARRFDFVKVGLGEAETDEKGLRIVDDKGQYKVKTPLYNTRQVTAKPVDGTMMKVKFAE